jgi:hypothetical protein
MNIGVVIYSGLWRPLDTRLRNRLNLFNEAMIMTISTHLAFFTDAVDNEITKYRCGWSMIIFLIITMLLNLALFLRVCAHNVYLILLKYGRIIDSKMQKRNQCYKSFRAKKPKVVALIDPPKIIPLALPSGRDFTFQ